VKAQRQRALVELIRREPLGSQEQIRDRLGEIGFTATQSTISRDLEELGLVRVHANGGMRYAELAEGNGSNGHHTPALDSLLREFALDVVAAQNIVLIKTPPGTANALAQGLDQSDLDGLLGTVAGDDTILAVAKSDRAAKGIVTKLKRSAGLPSGSLR
jgi:transcriptional regulator of arginine metabolism